MKPTPNLGPRLRAVAEFVPRTEPAADLGCDHALLATALVIEGPRRSVIAADMAPGAVKMARATRARFGLGERLDIRRGDGVRVLAPGEASCVVVAGVGGRTMLHMLDLRNADASTLESLGVTRLVLQPQAAAGAVRAALHDVGWAFADERLVEEAGRTYVVLECVRAGAATRSLEDELDAEFGPWIRHRPDPLFERQLRAEATRTEFLLRRLVDHGAPASRIAVFETRLARLRAERTRVVERGGGS